MKWPSIHYLTICGLLALLCCCCYHELFVVVCSCKRSTFYFVRCTKLWAKPCGSSQIIVNSNLLQTVLCRNSFTLWLNVYIFTGWIHKCRYVWLVGGIILMHNPYQSMPASLNKVLVLKSVINIWFGTNIKTK